MVDGSDVWAARRRDELVGSLNREAGVTVAVSRLRPRVYGPTALRRWAVLPLPCRRTSQQRTPGADRGAAADRVDHRQTWVNHLLRRLARPPARLRTACLQRASRVHCSTQTDDIAPSGRETHRTSHMPTVPRNPTPHEVLN